MPSNEVNQIALEDYMELETAHTQAEDTTEDGNTLTGNAKIKSLRNKIDTSKTSRSAVMPFWASVDIDMERREPIGLKNLFTIWLDSGNKYWLNPMDKSNGLGVLEETLFKYQGDIRVLKPFILLLTQLANDGISPRSFVEYVMLPRMRNDYNWRKWQENHLEPVQIIAGLITTAKQYPPFNKEHLGAGRTKLARDIVLVRYIGRPLAQCQTSQLRDDDKLKRYREAWQKISLQQPLSLYFMRNNALHFIYIMSGKIDLIQLVAIVEQLPDIERAFNSAFPDSNINLKKVRAINLYDYDIDYAIQARKNKGYHSLDFAMEIKAYYNIVKALLQKATGAYLCAYYAGLLKRYKDPVFAQTIYNLVRILVDRGGMHIYKWHTEKLLGQPKMSMQTYIDYIETHRGCDPIYPRIHLIFRDEPTVREAIDILNLATGLGLNVSALSKKETISYKDLLNAYISENPDTQEMISDFQDELLSGRDRQWTIEYTKQLDTLGNGQNNLYGPLMRSVIRGIGRGWAHTTKASSFTPLYEQFSEVHTSLTINIKTEFKMPVKQIGQTTTERDVFARKQINLIQIEKVWEALCEPEQLNVNNTVTYINNWNIALNEPLRIAFEKKISMDEEFREFVNKNEDIDTEIKEKQEKALIKQDKTIAMLQEKKEHYNKIIEKFDRLNEKQKLIAAIVLAGNNKTDDVFSYFTTTLLLQRYKDLEAITSRLDFLKDDISVDVLSYQQFTYIINLLETLFFVLHEDKEITVLIDLQTEDADDNILQEMLEPYIITKKKQITIDAVDAAAKRMTGFSALQAERAKWLGILESMEEESDKYFHPMEIYVSKTFIDSHYGDMGGICLSALPGQILRPGFYVQRLADLTDRQIIGMSLLYLSTSGFSTGSSAENTDELEARNYWHAFGFNPLYSILNHYTSEQALFLYMQFRLNIEKIAWKTKLPVVLSGIETSWGLISNHGHFANLIRSFELSKPTAKRVNNAKGFSVYYSHEQFAKALVIIDPRGYEDPLQVPSFYAHKIIK